MAYKVTISDGTILEKSIDFVTFKADTPSDDFYEMRDYTINSMTITGRIGAGEKTISLYEWALLPASNPKCYKEIEVEHTHAGQVIRKVKFSMGFVVDYSESFAKNEGVGHFSILVRQLSEIDIDVTSQSPQGAVIASKPGAIIEKEVVPVVAQEASAIVTTKKPEGRMSITDRIAKRNRENGYNEIKKFREREGIQPYSEDSGDTVARIEVEGQAFFGVNSTITPKFEEATKELRQKWFEKVKWVPPKKNVPKHLGHVQSLTHAESHSLIEAFEKLGKLPQKITMYVDRKTCNMCKGEMPALLKHIGVEELTIFNGGNVEPLIIKAVL